LYVYTSNKPWGFKLNTPFAWLIVKHDRAKAHPKKEAKSPLLSLKATPQGGPHYHVIVGLSFFAAPCKRLHPQQLQNETPGTVVIYNGKM
jgi:hypothetical protein